MADGRCVQRTDVSSLGEINFPVMQLDQDWFDGFLFKYKLKKRSHDSLIGSALMTFYSCYSCFYVQYNFSKLPSRLEKKWLGG